MAEARQQIAGSADLPLAQDSVGRLLIAGGVLGGEIKGRIFNTAIGAAANFFTPALAPTSSPCTFRIYMAFDTAGIISIQRTSGGVTVAERLNQATALTVNSAYIFDIMVQEDDTINIQHAAGAQILYCLVVEI